MTNSLRLKPGTSVKLPDDFDPGHTGGLRKEAGRRAVEALNDGVKLLAEYQDRLRAQSTDALLVVVQGLDAAGKDSTVKHVMSGVDPQGVQVSAFKAPSTEELTHDFLWRTAERLPARGKIGIFNRSHYEEVLVVRVHPEALVAENLPPEDLEAVWKRRYREINDWERYLVDNGIHIVKLFLNVSWEEQRNRFLARIDDPTKNWKFTAADVRERAHWDAYQQAYADMLSKTSTKWAPWYVVPGDHKWFERIAAAAIIVNKLVEIDPQYPTVSPAIKKELRAARRELLAEPKRKT
ncbi:MAG: polyphosphate kinase 2 family protein [Candidatus Dormibacteraeota bacterium]|nr:polyphosphate kinase 2 family protein [Candidatus Dormibacteraeota bacterium]